MIVAEVIDCAQRADYFTFCKILDFALHFSWIGLSCDRLKVRQNKAAFAFVGGAASSPSKSAQGEPLTGFFSCKQISKLFARSTASDGSMHDIPRKNLGLAKQRDPCVAGYPMELIKSHSGIASPQLMSDRK